MNSEAWYKVLEKWQYLKGDKESKFGDVYLCINIFLKIRMYWYILHGYKNGLVERESWRYRREQKMELSSWEYGTG